MAKKATKYPDPKQVSYDDLRAFLKRVVCEAPNLLDGPQSDPWTLDSLQALIDILMGIAVDLQDEGKTNHVWVHQCRAIEKALLAAKEYVCDHWEDIG